MSRVMRTPDFCICENKDADQLCGNHASDQRLCFHYIDTCTGLPHYNAIFWVHGKRLCYKYVIMRLATLEQ